MTAEIAGLHAPAKLFGSCAREDLRVGDIDLLIEPKSGSYPVAGSQGDGLNDGRVGAILPLT